MLSDEHHPNKRLSSEWLTNTHNDEELNREKEKIIHVQIISVPDMFGILNIARMCNKN